MRASLRQNRGCGHWEHAPAAREVHPPSSSARTGDASLRIAIASGAAFLVAQLVDIVVFNALRNRRWWVAPLMSSSVGSVLDTAIFFTVAFSAALPHDANTGWANEAVPLLGQGPITALWVSLATADWMVKMSLAILALVPFRLIVRNLLRAERTI